MSNYPNIDYGPLSYLLGRWHGDQGVDVAPEEDGPESNRYYETIIFEEARDLDNAGEQDLVALFYHQVVFRKRDDKMMHNQTGYWIWDKANQQVMHNFVIPRGIGVLAYGTYQYDGERVLINVSAKAGDDYGNFTESPFLQQKAKTLSFEQSITLEKNKLVYAQTTLVDIYGSEFHHTDNSELIRQETE
jgi:hypothetical protein